jgi:hypothetical protein
MAGKYGTDYTGFGAYEGGVNSDKGANIVSTNSDGETSFIFGAPALRTIQAGCENGDFAIPPDNATAAITDENPLPYWTISGDTSIVATVESSTTAASGNVLQFLCLTPGSPSRSIKRYIPIPGALDRSFSFYFEVYLNSYSAGRLRIRHDWVTADLTTTGTGGNSGYYTSGSSLLTTGGVAPSDAAYIYVEIEATGAGGLVNLQISEARVNLGKQALYITDSDPTITPAKITSTSGTLSIVPATKTAVTGSLTTTSDIGVSGAIYGTTALTGPNIDLAGTNTRLWAHSSSAADVAASTSTTVSGVLITKVTAGQPSTNINGVATTDAFADALRNGGIAVDTTNNRAYFYSGGWKYAALTTPSDSRLKEEITEISGALDTLRQLVPVAFKWKRPEAHGRSDAVADDGTRLGFIADQVATTDLAHWVETLGVDEREADLIDTTEVLAVNIPQNEMEALVVQALLDIDTRLKALESR